MHENRPLPLWGGRSLALVGILLVALSLRTAVAAISPIVPQVSRDIPLNELTLGVIGMLPPVCFAVFGIITPQITRRIGLEAATVLSLGIMIAGHLLRAFAGDIGLLLAGSALAFAGMGIGNVLLPPLVKRYFPDRIGLMTSLYAAVLAVSTLVPPLIAAPLADSAGWRVSLGLWALWAFVAMLPWAGILITRRTGHAATRRSGHAADDDTVEAPTEALLGRVWHSRIAWAIGIVFAMSSFNAYAMFAWLPQFLLDRTDVSPAAAGSLLSLYAAMGLPAALLIPVVAARIRNVGVLVYAGVGCFVLGDLALLLVPGTVTWLWVVLVGAGPLLFPVALALINLRTRTHEMAVALSGFVQGVGYTLGALGPLLFGALHDATGDWVLPIVLLLTSAVIASIAALALTRPRMIEDELAGRSPRRPRLVRR